MISDYISRNDHHYPEEDPKSWLDQNDTICEKIAVNGLKTVIIASI